MDIPPDIFCEELPQMPAVTGLSILPNFHFWMKIRKIMILMKK